MSNPFAQLEKNLGRAGLLFVLVILGSAGLSLILGEMGYEPSVTIVLVWIAMPFVAWLMSRAARAQSKSPWLYGLASLIPPFAVVLFFSLRSHDTIARLDAAVRNDDA